MQDETELTETEALIDEVVTDIEQPAERAVQAPPRAPLPSANAKARSEERKTDRDAGRASVMEAYNKRAQALGFEGVEAMMKAGPGGKPTPKPLDRGAADAAIQAENVTLRKTIQGLRSRISVLENDGQLRQMAYEAGVQGEEIDYALSHLNGHYRKLSDTDAKSFDAAKYLKDDLRAKKPGIFQQVLQAQAERKIEELEVGSTPGGGAPRSMPPGEVRTEGAALSQPKQANEMTRAEYQEYLRKKGYKNPASMV